MRKWALFVGLFAQSIAWGFRPGEVEILSVTAVGAGCPGGSARAVLAPDASAVTVIYDGFEARVSGPVTSTRKQCDVSIKLKKPKLFAFAVESADFRGFVGLQRGAKASQRVKIESGTGTIGKVNVNLAQQTWRGPLEEGFNVSAVKPVEGLKYLSCLQPNKDALLKIKSDILVENGGTGAEGLIAIDSFDGGLVQKYNLKWMNCVAVGIGIIGGLLRGR